MLTLQKNKQQRKTNRRAKLRRSNYPSYVVKFVDSINRAFDILLPLPDVKISDFADTHRRLSSEYSNEPGNWDTSRAEYQREIMDSFVDPKTYKIVWMAPVQVGKSAVIENILLHFSANDPRPIILARPTQQDGEKYSKERLAALIRDTPILRKLFGNKSRSTDNTLDHKKFPGGYLAIVGSNSPMDLAGRPAPIVLMDERSRFAVSAGMEGDPGSILEKRTSNFWNRKIGVFSSPTDKGVCPTEREFLRSDQRHLNFKCPECGEYHIPKFEYLKYEIEETSNRVFVDSNSIRYACPKCGVLISPNKKAWMIRNSIWIATKPFTGIAGFHMTGLHSPWVTWETIIQEYLDCRNNPIEYKTWLNTRMSETYEEKSEVLEWEKLYARREFYPLGIIPEGGIILLGSGDVQHNRIEVELVAYGKNMESWSVDYRVLYGDTSQPEVWRELDLLLDSDFNYGTGGSTKIRRFGIDTGDGTRTAFIYLWARKHGPKRVLALKGSSSRGMNQIISPPRKIDINYNGEKIPGGVQLWFTGTNIIKSEFYSFLSLSKPEKGKPYPFGYCHFPDYPENIFKMYVAEERRLSRHRNGAVHYEWINPSGKRNEGLDCRVMNRAVAESLGIPKWTDRYWDKASVMLRNSLQPKIIIHPQSQQPVVQGQKSMKSHVSSYRPVGRPIS